jgi:hypothetical protein
MRRSGPRIVARGAMPGRRRCYPDAVTTESGLARIDLTAVAKVRPRSEVVLLVVQPWARWIVGVLARFGVDPQHVVWTHALLGTLAAFLIAFGGPASWWVAAVLLVLKVFLDNVDGGLARATGRVTRMGRYLDTVLDTAVNALLFVALAVHGPAGWAWPLALGGYALLVAMLSLDFNLERRYKTLRAVATVSQVEPPVPDGAPARLLAAFEGFYDRFLAPQDVAVDRLDEAAFRRLSGLAFTTAPLELRLAWNDLWSTATLVNLGLSSQLVLLALCLAAGVPFAYVAAVYAMALFVVVTQAGRALRFRRFARVA